MNVIIANEQQEKLSALDIDIIKAINGEYESSEIVEMFKNFFYSKMILDVTALKNYKDVKAYYTLVQGLEKEKIVFFLPEGSEICTPNFLAKLIDIGIYNFTTNIDGIKYLVRKSNTYEDVKKIREMAMPTEPVQQPPQTQAINNSLSTFDDNSLGNNEPPKNDNVTISNQETKPNNSKSMIVGIKNVTPHAGSTSLIYMLKKELEQIHGKNGVVAIELNRNDFHFFFDNTMVSITANDLNGTLSKYSNTSIILVDVNDVDESFCNEVYYLLEPSTLQLNKLVSRNKDILSKLKSKKIILNRSLLTNNDINDFEYEANIRVFFNIPPLNDRKKNEILNDFITRSGMGNSSGNRSGGGRIFGLFKK